MRTVQLKTFNQNFNYQGHFFFILSKGMNSGKPLKSPCPNCFVCICQSEQEKELLYWLSFGLWHAKAYHSYLRGSLYFYASPNADSIAPAVEYFRKDVEHLIETLKWK